MGVGEGFILLVLVGLCVEVLVLVLLLAVDEIDEDGIDVVLVLWSKKRWNGH